MSKHVRAKLASQRPTPENQILETKEEPSPEQREEDQSYLNCIQKLNAPDVMRLWNYIPNSTN